MKRAIFIVVCVLGIMCFASCRSTSSSCGLADNNITTNQTTLQQADLL